MSQKQRGFASMDQESRREVARKGGRAAHQRGTAHEWTAEEAREAGRKGGGVLLCSGDDSVTSRVDDLATGLDNIATALDHLAHRRSATTPQVIRSIRQSIEKATDAIDRIEKRITA
ncbi:MAG TPA: KGG domain-containing protein [Vicinamibacterales bacterium]|nr:KGG domain-containing protein [Vicinamibacterales bacterium]